MSALSLLFALSFMYSQQMYSNIHASVDTPVIDGPFVEKVTESDYSKRKVKKEYKTKNKIDIYVTSWCPYCTALEKKLGAMKVKYRRYDIEKDREANLRFMQLGGEGFPLIKIDSVIIHGFDEERLDSLLYE